MKKQVLLNNFLFVFKNHKKVKDTTQHIRKHEFTTCVKEQPFGEGLNSQLYNLRKNLIKSIHKHRY